MTKPSIATKLDRAQDRISSLQDILQDTFYLAEAAHLPACNLYDLKRSIEATEAIFANLAAIRARLERTHPHLRI